MWLNSRFVFRAKTYDTAAFYFTQLYRLLLTMKREGESMPELPTKLVDRLREAKASIWKMVHGDDAWSNCISISSVNLSKRDPFVADFRKNIQSKLVKLATEFVTKDNGVTRNSRNS